MEQLVKDLMDSYYSETGIGQSTKLSRLQIRSKEIEKHK